jgi:hypothetical protein
MHAAHYQSGHKEGEIEIKFDMLEIVHRDGSWLYRAQYRGFMLAVSGWTERKRVKLIMDMK